MWKKRMMGAGGSGGWICNPKTQMHERVLLYSFKSFACLVCLSIFKLK